MLRWSFMLFVLSMVEGILGHSTGEGSLVIAKISLVLSISLFALFHWWEDRKDLAGHAKTKA